jgi:hypothetical protein
MRNGLLSGARGNGPLRGGRCAARHARRWRLGTLLAWAALLAAGAAPGGVAWAADPLEVVQLVLAEREIAAGGPQIVQITLRATGARAVRAGLRVELRDARDARAGKAIDRVVQIAGGAEQREFFRFEAPNRFGKFTVRLEVFTPDFASRLLAGAPVFFAPFAVGSVAEPALAAPKSGETAAEPGHAAKAGPPSFAAPRGLSFEKPDLVWENLDVQPSSLLVGEALKIKADLRNVGGDIARQIEVKVDYFNLSSPGRLIPISRPTVQVLAPGDKVEMEFETIFPENSLLGDYRVRLEIDPEHRIQEISRENNTLVSEVPIQLSFIKLVFPEPGYYFEQAGLFLFRWDSRRFNEFKVQVGTDPAFATKGSSFDIPQGDKWTKEREIVPLEGEVPDMALGLMEKAHADQLYWRVVGRSAALGLQSVSQASPFSIRRPTKAAAQARPEGAAGAAQPPAEPSKERVTGPQGVQPPARPSEARRPTEAAPLSPAAAAPRK